ncbi:MAG: cache domain-containing protein [Candidatus Muirbacterium halophilum]|nr:cache domain-containing protein [Candidatus Muirbacterium halophilum]
MKKKSFINKFFIYNILLFIVGTAVLSYFLTYNQYIGFDKEINQTKENFISDNKVYIKNNVENIIDYIYYKKNQKEEISRKKVRGHIYNLNSIIKTLDEKFQNKSLDEKRDFIIPFLRSYSFNDNKGYVFGIETNGNIIFNRNNTEFEGKNINNISDINVKKVFKSILDSLENTNESIVSYIWENPSNQNKNSKKFTYSKYIEELDLILCCGDYYEDIVKELKEETITRIKNTRLLEDEDFMIFDENNKIILHKKSHIEGFSLLNIYGINGNAFFESLKNSKNIQNGIFTEENFSLNLLTNKITPRMIYIKKIPDWDWYISTGIFYDKLNLSIIEKTNSLKLKFKYFILKIFFIIITFVIVGNLFIYIFFKKLKYNFNNFLSIIRNSIIESTPVNTDSVEYSEFVDIFLSTNNVLEEMRKSHSDLIKSEKRYKIAQKIMNVSHWEYNTETDEYVFSPEYYNIFGLEKNINQNIFHEFLNKIHIDDREKVDFIINHSKKTKKDWKIHYRIIVNNKITWIEEIAEFYFEPQSKKKSKTRIIGVVRDITKEKTANLSLIEAKEKAERSDRLKSDFLANMSHEVKTPLTTIIGFSDVLIKNSSNENNRFLSNIKRAANYLKNIMDNILDISKIESGDFHINNEKFKLYDFIENIKDYYNNYVINRPNIEFLFTNNIDKEIIINSDSSRIKQIIINLLDNAFKFTENGFVEFNAIYSNNILKIRIKDSGIGISDEEKVFIFEKFRQVDSSITRKFSGLGLGLSIVNNIVDLLRGYIEFESFKGIGTEFTINIPNIDNNNIILNEKINILVVEDNRQNNELIREFLCYDKNITIFNSYNGIEAIKILKENSIDVILSDIQMPDMDGIELMKFIKSNEKFNNIKIIALTAHAMAHDRNYFLNKGFDEYIAKPFSSSKLLNTIYSVFNKNFRK